LSDLSAERFTFNARAADRPLRFFEGLLRHSKGEWAGRPLILEPWQAFIVASLFGWLRDDGTRRYRTAYVEVPKKNGKSTLAAGIGLYLLVADDEPGAEVYCAATKRDQAKLVWEEARRMVVASSDLRGYVHPYRTALVVESTSSKFEPLGRDEDSMDGLNVHGVIIDELHRHASRDVHDVLKQSTSSRRQPLVFEITTAGSDRYSICWEEHEYAERILDGVIEDESFFGYVATVDEGDRWDAPATWRKANPNLGVSKKLDKLEDEAEAAKSTPAKQSAFRRYHLDEWTAAESAFVDLGRWDQCAGDLLPLEIERANLGRICYAGLDLSSTQDLSAFVMVFPRGEGEPSDVVCRFWIPRDTIPDRIKYDRVPYDLWERDGWVIATDGEAIDHDAIVEEILSLAERYRIAEVSYDRWGAASVQQQLAGEGLTVVQCGQGYASMSAPTKELERLILCRGIRHGGHPVLRWNAANVQVTTDAAGNIKPVKPKHGASGKRIDGIVSLIMGLDRIHRHEQAGPSVYESRGMVSL
jgi:phage terminase large subunit-like protein